jgi:uncharacterized protein (DUF433 family)
MFERITFDSQMMGARACIRGMRIPVSVVGQIAHDATDSRATRTRGNSPGCRRLAATWT